VQAKSSTALLSMILKIVVVKYHVNKYQICKCVKWYFGLEGQK
jgi:hypothetical protein